jgi:hypothetical protein
MEGHAVKHVTLQIHHPLEACVLRTASARRRRGVCTEFHERCCVISTECVFCGVRTYRGFRFRFQEDDAE